MLRSLIIQLDTVTRIKLSQFLGSRGTCSIASGSRQASDMFQAALRDDESYHLVTLDASLPDVTPADMVRRFRRLESFENPLPGSVKAKILLIAPSNLPDPKSLIESTGCDAVLCKPFKNDALVAAVRALGLEQAPEKPAARPLRNAKVEAPAMTQSLEEERLAALLQQAAQMNDEQFTEFASALVDRLGAESDALFARAMSSAAASRAVLMRLTHAAGRLKRTALGESLKEIARTNPNLNIRREAILAISGFNNEQAVHLLKNLLQSITVTSLNPIINNEISRITEKNPHLALIQTFREGEKDIKSFHNSLIVLKRIVRPEDLSTFLPMLEAEALLVRTGAFELLCEKLGKEESSQLLGYFENTFSRENDSTETIPGSRYHLALQLERYLQRHPEIIVTFGERLKVLLEQTEDPRIRESFLGIFCTCPGRPYYEFVISCYQKWPDIREGLIPRLAEDDRCIDFLLEEFRKGGRQADSLLTALLSTEKGCRYFAAEFNHSDTDFRLKLLDGVQPGNYEYLRDMVKSGLQDRDRDVRTAAMDKIRMARDFEAGEVLFDADRQAEFLKSEGSYIAVIAEVFPFKAISLFLSGGAPNELTVRLLTDHLDIFRRLCEFEPVPSSLDYQVLHDLIQYSAALSYEELCQHLLRMLAKLKAYHRTNLTILQNAFNHYVSLREQSFTPQETKEVKMCREMQNGLAEEIRVIEEGYRNIDLMMRKPQLDYGLLQNIIRAHHPSFCLRRREVIERLKDRLASQDAVEISKARGFIMKHRLLPCCFQDQLDQLRIFPGQHVGPKEHPRFNLHFSDKPAAAFLGAHLDELFPEFPVVLDAPVMSEDCLVADLSGLRKAIPTISTLCARKFVVLDDPTQFQEVKDLNPVTFVAPLSIYRLMKTLLQDMFL